MSRLKIFFILALCLLPGLFAQQLLSQGMRPGGMPRPDFERMHRMNPEEKTRYFQEFAAEQRRIIEEQEALAMQQALGADDQQWRVIGPKLKKVRACRDEASVSIGQPFQSSFTSSVTPGMGGQGFGGGFSGGFQFQASSSQGTGFQSFSPFQNSGHPPTEGERICEELQMLLQNPGANPAEINLKLAALRQAREKAGRQLVLAQQELRKVLNFRQQAMLTLMGLLD